MTADREPVRFTPCAGESWRAPWEMYAALRDAGPLHHVAEGDYWVLSRYADVLAAARDTERFSSAGGLTVGYGERERLGITDAAPLVMLDPPEHTDFRRLLTRGYTPRRVASIEPEVRAFVRSRLDRIAQLRGGCDIVAELFKPLPSFVVGRYLGVPEADRARFDGWTHAIVEAGAAGDPLAAGAAVTELFGYFAELVERRRAEPADDTVSDLVRLLPEGGGTALLRILGFAFTMVAGGNDTTTGLLGGAAELLTAHPDQRRALRDDPALLPGAVEELLRLTSPVQCLARTVTADLALHGRTVPAGRKVLLLYGAANRDPRAFGPDAELLDITRDGPQHLAFTHGPHHCLGAAAARLMARVALEELLARFPEFAVDAAAGTFAGGPYVRRYATLPFVTGRS
ncbi:cytochrome [Streptomyces sp. NRRL F-4489]|uniref:cytochrome P450 n=1 Tax=Streptomyces sp. NRRL F-4489 TaxID=1609095 RepID=UPI0007474CBF|nr:cytochrome P450 [Streptomyces sp. NRRL F-4489]KUL52565.1 cytochrome [Streptomyces sp. NRRL F-4489]